MLTVRKASARGAADHGWLVTRHTFSFADYHDEAHMGFRALRVINEDRVAPGAGFPPHGHRDMEILTWVLDGALAHRDSLGNGSTIRPGDAQWMSAASGIRHSEYNALADAWSHFLQIWILPDRAGGEPTWAERTVPREERLHRLRTIAAPDGADGALPIRADVRVLAGLFTAGDRVVHPLAAGRHAWVQVARGGLTVNGTALAAGDGVALSDLPAVELAAHGDAEALVFDLA